MAYIMSRGFITVTDEKTYCRGVYEVKATTSFILTRQQYIIKQMRDTGITFRRE